MKGRPKPLRITLMLLPLLAFAVFHLVHSRSALSEAGMLANFHQNKMTLVELSQMAREDKMRWTNGVDSDPYEIFDHYDKKSGITSLKDGPAISSKRLAKYKQLMEQCGVQSVGCDENGSSCSFYFFGGGFGDTTWSIGYEWTPTKPTPLVSSAYYYKGQMRDTAVYSPIEKDWYIYNSR